MHLNKLEGVQPQAASPTQNHLFSVFIRNRYLELYSSHLESDTQLYSHTGGSVTPSVSHCQAQAGTGDRTGRDMGHPGRGRALATGTARPPGPAAARADPYPVQLYSK